MIPRLLSISISDFRSVRGLITVPLDAPVVLIHGPNGVGKTSVLSALELGLTGQVPSMARVDPAYVAYLPHRDVAAARIILSASGLGSDRGPAELSITRDAIQNAPLLTRDLSRFFSERCYLAQSTLSRLLEIYQHKDSRQSDSPLTEFVKDLLGLNQLDALIDGLHTAGDVRRLRRAVPEYLNTEEARTAADGRLTKARDAIAASEAERAPIYQRLSAALGRLQSNNPLSALPSSDVDAVLNDDREELRLTELAAVRHTLDALKAQWASLATAPGVTAQAAAEVDEKDAAAALARWREGDGTALEILINELGTTFPNLPSPGGTDPEFARSTAASSVVAELNRCIEQLDRQEAETKQLAELDQSIARSQARIALLDEQIGGLAGDADGLAQALAQLLPHVHTDECPVCGRDYSEVSSDPLLVRVTDQVTTLRDRAGRLQALSREKSEAIATQTALERERGSLISRHLSAELLTSLKTRRSMLTEAATRLEALQEPAINGVALLTRAARSAQILADLRGRDQALLLLRAEISRMANGLGTADLGSGESVPEALDRVEQVLTSQQATLSELQHLRTVALKDWRQLHEIDGGLAHHRREAGDTMSLLARLDEALSQAEALRNKARTLSSAARETRTAIVRRVFNETLNSVWQDLFVRLAPDEQFVPAFALPENTSGPVEAILETRYRSGGRGGNPRAILSAGNLNTAALTLFLALHLSVEAKFPWLILDDPVQSMDELHIAQFAALLRTLSKQQGRQIVISVHERPLFDYLALELSPAFQGDRLITIELGRSSNGMTTVNYEPRVWEPDTAVAAE
jgi:exonuclease SbcC